MEESPPHKYRCKDQDYPFAIPNKLEKSFKFCRFKMGKSLFKYHKSQNIIKADEKPKDILKRKSRIEKEIRGNENTKY